MPRLRSTADHGSHARYQAGCRCDDCKAGRAAYAKAARHRGPKTPKPPRWRCCEVTYLLTGADWMGHCRVCHAIPGWLQKPIPLTLAERDGRPPKAAA